MKKLLSTTIFSGLLLLTGSAIRAQGSLPAQGSIPAQGPASPQDPARAQGSVPAQDSTTIQYLGMQDDQVIFHIAHVNSQGSPFNLIVRDQDGSELYQHGFHDRFFNKQFRLPRTDKSKLSFIIRSGKDEIVRSFEIDTRVIEDVVVTQLK